MIRFFPGRSATSVLVDLVVFTKTHDTPIGPFAVLGSVSVVSWALSFGI